MYKKQILKIGSKKKKAGLLLATAMLMGAMTTSVVTAGNVRDEPYDFHCEAVGGSIEPRDKDDDTSCYIYHKGYVPVWVQVRNGGVNYTANGGSYYANVGVPQYLPNYIKENNLDSCYLYLTPTTGNSSLLYGVWSPDSV